MKPTHRGLLLRPVFALLLAGTFFLLAMGVALLGSNVYRASVADAGESSAHRVALSYVINQIRRGDKGGVTVTEFKGCSAVSLTEVLPDGTRYTTKIYCYDGQLRELYTEADADLAPEDGIAIAPLESLNFSVDGGRILVAATDGTGQRWSVCVTPRTGILEVAL